MREEKYYDSPSVSQPCCSRELRASLTCKKQRIAACRYPHMPTMPLTRARRPGGGAGGQPVKMLRCAVGPLGQGPWGARVQARQRPAAKHSML